MSDKCLRCKVRGDCCYVNMPIEGYNLILDNVHCPELDIETGLCTCYNERHKHPWCLDDSEMFEKGCLPKDCEYLKDGNIENIPKLHLGDVLNDGSIPNIIKQKIWSEFLHYDKKPFELYIKILHKKEEIKV